MSAAAAGVAETVEAVYRAESRRVLATLIRLLGDFDLAEEALHEAFRAALEQWPRDGVPANVETATTVRVRNGKVSISDGPFAETKEQLAGFYLIEARDLNDAIQVASKIPPAREGSVEVRPVRELNPQ